MNNTAFMNIVESISYMSKIVGDLLQRKGRLTANTSPQCAIFHKWHHDIILRQPVKDTLSSIVDRHEGCMPKISHQSGLTNKAPEQVLIIAPKHLDRDCTLK